MCGIAGVVRVHEPGGASPPPPLESIPESWLDVLDDSIAHRGPDGEGRFRDRATRDDGTVVDVALVHRRLSIIDHEGGAQPMVHDEERLRPDLVYHRGEAPIVASEVEGEKPLVAVVFNGCIYNHRELREELEAKGHVFGSDHSDTEVLVHSWRAWGDLVNEAAVTRWLNGMYAVLFWDRERGICQGRRDPFGEKPLQISFDIDAHTTAWCSSRSGLEGLWTTTGTRRNESERVPTLTKFIPGWIRHGWSNYRDIVCDLYPASDAPPADEPVLPSHFGVQAWISRQDIDNAIDPDRADELIRKAVERRLDADVPLGCFLSGGIDSALIAHYSKESLGSLRTFTVRMPERSIDESEAAAQTAAHLGTEHETLECPSDVASELVRLIEQIGVPFGDSSLLPSFWVSQAARLRISVALSGDGGDELFAGYERHRAPDLINRLPWGSRFIPLGLVPDRDARSKSSKLRRLLGAARCGRTSLGPELAAIFPHHDLKRLLESSNPGWEIIDPLEALGNRAHDPRSWDATEYLQGDLCRKTDSASMSAALEVRCPFLDPELAAAALGTPTEIMMPNGERKGLLKQVARKYLTDHIVDRPKQGFAVPVGEWFRTDFGDMRQLLLDHLRSSDPFPGIAEMGPRAKPMELNTRFVERMLREHDAAGEKSINPWRGRDHSQRLYMLLVLSIWCKWLERVRKEKPAAGAG